jgi:hypothetical protein
MEPPVNHMDDDLVEVEFSVVVTKTDEGPGGVGVTVQRLAPGDQFLWVSKVQAGPLMDWNDYHPDREVRAGDSITAVNGVVGIAEVLMAIIATEKRLDLTVQGRRSAMAQAVLPMLINMEDDDLRI